MENGVKDQIEQFNWQRDMATQDFPSTMLAYFDEVKSFCDRVHGDVLYKVYRRKYLSAFVSSRAAYTPAQSSPSHSNFPARPLSICTKRTRSMIHGSGVRDSV